MYDAALQLYNKLLGICLDEYEEFSDAEIKKKVDFKYNPINLTLDTHLKKNGLKKKNQKIQH